MEAFVMNLENMKQTNSADYRIRKMQVCCLKLT